MRRGTRDWLPAAPGSPASVAGVLQPPPAWTCTEPRDARCREAGSASNPPQKLPINVKTSFSDSPRAFVLLNGKAKCSCHPTNVAPTLRLNTVAVARWGSSLRQAVSWVTGRISLDVVCRCNDHCRLRVGGELLCVSRPSYFICALVVGHAGFAMQL